MAAIQFKPGGQIRQWVFRCEKGHISLRSLWESPQICGCATKEPLSGWMLMSGEFACYQLAAALPDDQQAVALSAYLIGGPDAVNTMLKP